MWYLMNMDDGIIEEGRTKSEIMLNHNSAHRSHFILNKMVYHVEDEFHDYYLYSSREQAIADGFDWAFNN